MTKTDTSGTRYAKTAHEQPNANATDAKARFGWEDYHKASAADPSKQPAGTAKSSFGYARVYQDNLYRVYRNELCRPWTFAGNNFDLNIPECAYIKKITFTAKIRVKGKITVKAPKGRFNLYHGTKNVKNNIKNDTGWKDGYYQYNPNKNLSNNWQSIEYVMTGDEFRRRGYPVSELNTAKMGIDLSWYHATSVKGIHEVEIQYVACKVDYELPDESVVITQVTTEDNPLMTESGTPFRIIAKYYNNSNAGCCGNTAKVINVKLPPNVTATKVMGQGDYSDGEWTVQCVPNAFSFIALDVMDYGIGEKSIDFQNKDVNARLWYYSASVANDVGEVTPHPDTYMQKGLNSCVTFKSLVNASDGKATFNINMDTLKASNPNVKWSIISEKTSPDVSLKTDECTNNKAVFNVPREQRVEITFKGCYVPTFTGETSVTVNLDGKNPKEAEYIVLPAPVFHVRNTAKTTEKERGIEEIVLNPSTLEFITHRIASTTELGAYVIDCGVDEFDKTMVEKECTLTADVWEQVDYIGVVPLEYHHYDPDSTYSNKAISNSYKNKTYKGKEGVIDEKISLKFKARPWQVPTLQGLTKLDKPTPINANHKCFEGDPLNHRGWAVLSEIKAERTNPLWYDVEAEVDYITHDIHTKFQIFKELAVNNVPMPDLTVEVVGIDENLATRLDIFNVTTDGGFIYDEDGEDGTNNIFSLDEGQKLNINTVKALSDVANIRFDWYSNRINELRENNLERVIRLRDESGESVFEYEYTNFKFYEDYITCTAIVRIKTADGWATYEYPDLDMRMEVEADLKSDVDEESEVIYDDDASEEEYYKYNSETRTYELVSDEDYDGDLYTYDEDTDTYNLIVDGGDEPAYEEGYVAPAFDLNKYNVTQIYGTSLLLHLNGSKLQIVDEGYNGREFVSDEIQLISKNYHFETEWKNNNVDGNTEDIISYIGLSLEETILETDYSQYYKDTVVSPFPIPYKTVMFTRKSEEGTIYYLTGGEPYKYMLEPFYQYYCGCDLLGDRTSIFDLNNSYTYYYIENGLVRLGFNKYNGRLYLAKYDAESEEWITTHYFHLVNEPKFAVETYSDDKIVIKAGNDTFFTIWRGRPFIGIKNPTDTIYIDSNFSYCLSDKINGDEYTYPRIFSFNNTDNMLPMGIGGNTLDSDEFTIDDDEEIIITSYDITLSIPSDIYGNDEVNIIPTITPTPTTGKVHLIVNGEDVTNSETPFTVTHTFKSEGAYKIYAVYVGNENDDIAISPVYDVVVKPRPLEQDPKPEVQGAYNMRIVSAPKKFVYRDGQKVVIQLRKGTTEMPKMIVEKVVPSSSGSIYTAETDNNGKVEIRNSDERWLPGKHQWGARFYDPENGKLVCEALRWITIEKATPTFTHNAANGIVSKGKSLTVKLNGVDSKADSKKAGLAKHKVTYKEGRKKGSTETNANGKFSVKFNTRGTKKLKVIFAGNKRYKAVSKTFTIKVV